MMSADWFASALKCQSIEMVRPRTISRQIESRSRMPLSRLLRDLTGKWIAFKFLSRFEYSRLSFASYDVSHKISTRDKWNSERSLRCFRFTPQQWYLETIAQAEIEILTLT